MLERGLTGEKAGQGFYKRVKNASGESEILTLDPNTLEYRPRQSPKLALPRSRQVDHRRRRADPHAVQRERQGWSVPSRDARARARLHRSRDARDRAFGRRRRPRHAMGLRLGARAVRDCRRDRHSAGPRGVAGPASAGPPRARSAAQICPKPLCQKSGARPLPADGIGCATARSHPRHQTCRSCARRRSARRRQEERRRQPRRSRRRRARVEFHSKMNAIGGDTIQMLQAGVREASKNFAALVVGNDGRTSPPART